MITHTITYIHRISMDRPRWDRFMERRQRSISSQIDHASWFL